MAIKIKKKAEREAQKALEAEVLPSDVLPIGNPRTAGDDNNKDTENSADEVKLPGMEDKFLQKSGSAMQWLLEHRNAVIGYVSAGIVLALAIIMIINAQERSAERDSSLLSQALNTYIAPTEDEAKLIDEQREAYMKSQGIVSNDFEPLKISHKVKDDPTRFALIAKGITDGTPALGQKQIASTGQLALAGAASRLKKFEPAAKAYENAGKNHNSDVSLFGKLGSVEILIHKNDLDAAISLLDHIANDNQYPGFASYATLEKARVLEMKGDNEKAIQTYTQVLNLNRQADIQQATARLRFLTPDWESIVAKAEADKNSAAQAAAQAAAQNVQAVQ